ncbi:MAG: hypothetical protein ACYDC2_08740 [Solirubrobacteraceae bacterium]
MSTGPQADWFRRRVAGAGLVGVGAEEHAGRVWRSRRGRRARRAALAAGAALALCCAAAGVALSIAPGSVAVSMTVTTFRIGSATLSSVGPRVYSGDGALVLSRSGSDVAAGASAVVNGVLWVGACEVDSAGTTETCRLQTGTRILTARDVWSGGGWQRTYSDGQRVEIAAERGVPIPFPVGR